MKTLNLELPGYKVMELGFNALSDAETLSLIIGSSAVEKCKILMQKINYNLRELSRLSIRDLVEAGLTKKEAQALTAALEIGRRKNLSEALDRSVIKSSKDAFDIVSPLLSDLNNECFYIIYLNRTNRVLKVSKLSEGGLSGTVTDVKMILREALQNRASGLIACHNHPSGNMQPSEADSKITKKIKEAAELMDIHLLDHVIIANTDYYSFADNGMI